MTDLDELVVLVNEEDGEVGAASKRAAHALGQLHRAVSVFLFDDDSRLLLQQRALSKYHSGGRWSNSCCGHPRPGEAARDAAQRRLHEELGVDRALEHAVTFTYRVDVGEGWIEHEVDHVFVGRFAGVPVPDPAEVSGWRYASGDEITRELAEQPETYTRWFRFAWDALVAASQSPGSAGASV